MRGGVKWSEVASTTRTKPESSANRRAVSFLSLTGLHVARQLHSTNRFQGPAQSADSVSSLRRREVRRGFLSYQLNGRMRADLSDAGVGSDRTAPVFIAFDGSGAAQVP